MRCVYIIHCGLCIIWCHVCVHNRHRIAHRLYKISCTHWIVWSCPTLFGDKRWSDGQIRDFPSAGRCCLNFVPALRDVGPTLRQPLASAGLFFVTDSLASGGWRWDSGLSITCIIYQLTECLDFVCSPPPGHPRWKSHPLLRQGEWHATVRPVTTPESLTCPVLPHPPLDPQRIRFSAE